MWISVAAWERGAGFIVLSKHKNGLNATVIFIYERQLRPNEFLMDGIAVAPDRRGHGIGTRTPSELVAFVIDEEYATIRLDVINTSKRGNQAESTTGLSLLCGCHA